MARDSYRFEILGAGLALLIGALWDYSAHSKLRYALQYQIASPQVTVEKKPHDCDFLAAPMGGKYCHYDPSVLVVRYRKHKGEVVVSYDDGKTWQNQEDEWVGVATTDPPRLPPKDTVSVTWTKVED